LVAILVVPSTPAAGEGTAWSSRVWQADGLPEKRITGVAQTRDGFLWVSTPRHLCRFDGVRFEPFGVASLGGGDSGSVRALTDSRDGGLHLLVYGGTALHLRPGAASTVRHDLPLRLETVAEDEQGAVWVSSYDGAISRVAAGDVTHFGPAEGLREASRSIVARDGEGHVWFAQGNDLGVFADGRAQKVVHVPYSWVRIAPARAGGLWIGAGVHLYRYDQGTLVDRGRLPAEYPEARMMALLEAKDGAVWLGTRHDGVFRYDGARFETIPTSDSMILNLFQDREGDIWIGTAGGGLNRVQPRPVEVEGAATGVSSQTVQSLAEDSQGELWAATQNGLLLRRAGNGWEPSPARHDLPGAATTVAAAAAGGVFVGTRNSRLYHWRGGRVRSWGVREGLTPHTICTLLATRSGDLWIGGEGPESVQRLHGDRLESIEVPAKAHGFRAFTEDEDGAVWIGAADGVLLKAVPGASAADPAVPPVPARQIRALHATPEGIWVGYEGNGLGRVLDGALVMAGREHGLEGQTVTQILTDPRGSLWLGTDEGVLKVGRRALIDALEGRAPGVQPLRVGAEEAAFSVPTNGCGFTGAIATRDGRLWMPMGTALAVVHPERVLEAAAAPVVVLSRVVIDGRERAVYRGVLPPSAAAAGTAALEGLSLLSMAAGERRLDVEFTSPSYRVPENVRFRYRLQGLDEAWTAGTERRATYTRLAPGPYRFQVTACTAEGVCNPSAAELSLRVAPFVWQTWWFRAAAFLGFTAAVVVVVRRASFRRLRSDLRALEWRERLHKERARIARDIHDDIGNRLTTITLLTGLAQRDGADPARAAEHVRRIAGAARQVTDSLDEIVWAVNPRNDSVPQVVDYVGQFAVEFGRTAGLRVRVDLPARPPARTISAEARHGLFLVVKEALNNVVRHAGAQEVALRMSVEESRLDIVIEDDGTGFTPGADAPAGDGLGNMRQRVAEIGGQWRIESGPGRGTRVTLSVPLAAENGG
jgi:signal transduction histidine kinase/ligand-binding sensor domain-containing protein